MRILRILPPGRFPTVVHDPGRWLDRLATDPGIEVLSYSLNHAWWRVLCSPAVWKAVLAPLSATQRLRRRLEWSAADFEAKAGTKAAAEALANFYRPETYANREAYFTAVMALARHVEALNGAQDELTFSLQHGVLAHGLNYRASAELVRYANRDTLLARSMVAALEDCPEAVDLLCLSANSPFDFLTALIAARLLRERHPRLHICLTDHGYENFSLQPHLDRLRQAGTLDTIFDTVIESRDERDVILPALAQRIAAQKPIRGFLRKTEFPEAPAASSAQALPAPLVPTFSSEPVLWTRISQRRCYWSRCTFCTQNSKYDDPRVPTKSEIAGALDRIQAQITAGYRNLHFSDEAVSPALLRLFSEGILERGLSFRWGCRCKLDPSQTPELFRLAREAGCYEIIFGLESISPRVQKLMDKHVEGLDQERIAEIFGAVHGAGIALFINLIAGFPGDTPEETTASVAFLIDTCQNFENTTYVLNPFGLFPATPIMDNPAAFGVVPIEAAGDMVSAYGYDLDPKIRDATLAAAAAMPEMKARLNAAFGWDRLGLGATLETVQALYFEMGHGALFKAMPHNPLANFAGRPDRRAS